MFTGIKVLEHYKYVHRHQCFGTLCSHVSMFWNTMFTGINVFEHLFIGIKVLEHCVYRHQYFGTLMFTGIKVLEHYVHRHQWFGTLCLHRHPCFGTQCVHMNQYFGTPSVHTRHPIQCLFCYCKILVAGKCSVC